MSSNAYATPLRLDLKPSVILARLTGAAYLCALAAMVLSGIEFWQKALAGLLLAGGGIFHLLGYPLGNNRHRIRSLVWNSGTAWEIVRKDSGESASLGPETLVFAWLVILQLKPEQGRWLYLPILPDMLDKDDFRRLRVRLRMLRGTAKD